MIKQNKLITLLCITLLFFGGCSQPQNNVTNNEIIWGDIDFDANPVEKIEYPSLTERKEEIDINEYYQVIPIKITKEIESGQLADIKNDRYKIDRIQLNNVYFDINEIANTNDYNIEIKDGILNLDIKMENNKTIQIKLAQIYEGNSVVIEDELVAVLSEIIDEYKNLYKDNNKQSYLEYGGYYTYDKYVDFLNENPLLKHDITNYSAEQVLALMQNIFKLDDSITNNLIGTRLGNDIEYSRELAYFVTDIYFGNLDSNNKIELAIKRNGDAVFAFMVTYPNNINVNEEGNTYFSPLMIINFAQNNYYQLAETYIDYLNSID